jgi:hypothetical protein
MLIVSVPASTAALRLYQRQPTDQYELITFRSISYCSRNGSRRCVSVRTTGTAVRYATLVFRVGRRTGVLRLAAVDRCHRGCTEIPVG